MRGFDAETLIGMIIIALTVVFFLIPLAMP
jgi:hypothetical protein